MVPYEFRPKNLCNRNFIYTDTRIENFHDEDQGISITGFFKYGNQYKELHEDTVISFPFYEITFDILL